MVLILASLTKEISMYIEEYILIIGFCIGFGIIFYDAAKEAVLWAYDEWIAFRLRRNYRKLYWFLKEK